MTDSDAPLFGRSRLVNWPASGRQFSSEAWHRRVEDVLEAADTLCEARLEGCFMHPTTAIDRALWRWYPSQLVNLPLWQLAAVCANCCDVMQARALDRRTRPARRSGTQS